MTSSQLMSPKRRSVPHIVAPTIASFRDSLQLSDDPPQLRLSSYNDEHLVDHINANYGALDETDVNNGHCHKPHHDGVEAGYHHTEHISFDATTKSSFRCERRRPVLYQQWQCIERAASQIPAILLVTLFHLMVGIPFGVSYFPVSWKSSSSAVSGEDDAPEVGSFVLDGAFPLQGKGQKIIIYIYYHFINEQYSLNYCLHLQFSEALGIRMFLFSTIMGQLVFTYASSFNNCIALQMVENVPFCQALTYIVVEKQGYGKESLSTLFFLFGLASVIVGLTFYLLGRLGESLQLYCFLNALQLSF